MASSIWRVFDLSSIRLALLVATVGLMPNVQLAAGDGNDSENLAVPLHLAIRLSS